MRAIVLILSLLAACGGQTSSVPNPDHGNEHAPDSDSAGQDQASSPETTRDPDISLVSLDGTKTDLGAYRAPVTVVALWATYCAPCLRELPLIEALHQAYDERDDVAVLLVSVDEFDDESRKTISRILAEGSVTVPALIDDRHELIDRVAPRDAQGKPHYAVPMLVVIDEQFRLRRKLEIGRTLDEEVFLADVAPLVDAALRGEEVPPDEPYEAPLGNAFTGKRTMTLTVQNLAEHQIEHYLEDLRHQIGEMYPDLHGHQLDELMVEIGKRLHSGGGTFTVEIPAPHAGAH